MKLKIFAIWIIVIVLTGCQIRGDKSVPEELMGVWETSEPRYEGCSFEINDKLIIFKNGPTYTNVNHITDIDRSAEEKRTLYHINYVDRDGQEYKFSLFYYRTGTGGVIRFKNQKDIEWTRKAGQSPSQG